jgi:hypothetical protein
MDESKLIELNKEKIEDNMNTFVLRIELFLKENKI